MREALRDVREAAVLQVKRAAVCLELQKEYSLPLRSSENWFQNLSHIPKSTDVQVLYIKWHSIWI